MNLTKSRLNGKPWCLQSWGWTRAGVGELSGKPYGTSNSNTFLALKHGHGGFLFFLKMLEHCFWDGYAWLIFHRHLGDRAVEYKDVQGTMHRCATPAMCDKLHKPRAPTWCIYWILTNNILIRPQWIGPNVKSSKEGTHGPSNIYARFCDKIER